MALNIAKDKFADEYRTMSYEYSKIFVDEIMQILSEKVSAFYSIEKVLNRTMNVDIGIDTGDGGYEFYANCIYPAYDRYYSFSEVIPVSPLVWLAKQQGHKVSELSFALNNIVKNGHLISNEFVKSLANEVWHELCDQNQLYFFLKMSLYDLILLNSLMKWRYESKKWGGYIILSKDTTTGFYSPWLGSSSLLGIKPEREIKIPINIIHNISPDEAHNEDEGLFGWSLKSVVQSDTPWENGKIEYISLPKHFRLEMEKFGLEPVKKNVRRT